MRRDSVLNTFKVAFVLCLICSLLVSAAAVILRPYQAANQAQEMRKHILSVAGLREANKSIDKVFEERVEPRVVNLAEGTYNDNIDPATYDQREAANDPQQSDPVPREEDIARIGRREKNSLVYLVTDDAGKLDQIVLPIRGYGLWSTLRGFLSLDADGRTIRGLTFYEHKETPGLGGEVDNPDWKRKWSDPQHAKFAFDEHGNVRIEVVRGEVPEGDPNREYRVDGLSGATLTTRGVSNMLHYWLSDDGFGPFLARLRNSGGQHG